MGWTWATQIMPSLLQKFISNKVAADLAKKSSKESNDIYLKDVKWIDIYLFTPILDQVPKKETRMRFN